MATGLSSFTSQFYNPDPRKFPYLTQIANQDIMSDDVEFHRYKTRKKQSCQPKQINSNRNILTSFNSPTTSWVNTFMSPSEITGHEEIKINVKKLPLLYSL